MDIILQRQIITSIGEDAEKLEPSYNIIGNTKWYRALENSIAILQNLKQRVITLIQ